MSWLDPQRSQEPASESALREELRSLMGMKARNYFEAELTPELITLADDLRREAKRRNHTARKRSHWMLMAAVVPLALAFGGVSFWGVAQKHKAEDLAAAVHRQESELQRMSEAVRHQDEHLAVLAAHAPATAGTTPKAPHPLKGKELVEPVEHPAGQLLQNTQQVKGD